MKQHPPATQHSLVYLPELVTQHLAVFYWPFTKIKCWFLQTTDTTTFGLCAILMFLQNVPYYFHITYQEVLQIVVGKEKIAVKPVSTVQDLVSTFCHTT